MGRRIKVNKVPDGFVIKNGKILKKASYGGGFVTGDQKDYGLVTTYGADNGNGTQEQDVRFSLSSVPRDFANIEAEGGETVLTDLNDNGSFGLYNINGPRHSQGGVPMFLPDQSFIFSDTPKMRMTSEELAQFGIESKKRMTPAKVSKKFGLNEYIAAAGNPNSDHITEKSAELMLNKNMMSLSQLAFGQEMKKDFEDGVPTAAFPYIQSMGEDPINFAAMVDQQIQQRKQNMAAYGMEVDLDQQAVLPKAQEGREERSTSFADLPPAIEKAINEILKNASDPSSPEIQQQIKLIVDAAKGLGNTVGINTDQAEDVINNIVTIVADNVEELSKTGRLPLITESMAKIDNMLKSKGIDIQDVMDVGEKGIEDTQPKADSGLYGDVTMDNLPQFYENNKLLLQSLDYPSYQSLEEKHGKEWYKDPAFVKDFQTKKNESLLARYDADPELRAALDKQGITKDEFINAYGFRTDGVDGETDSIDGKFGEYTLNRRDFIDLPGVEEEEEEEEEEELPPGKQTAQPDFYLQDKIKMDALSKRDRDLFLPSRQAVEQIELNPALLDPTRAIASVNEQAAIAADAAGMFGPQTLSANLAKSTGTSYKNIADTLGKYDAANVGIINKADALQARFDQMTDAAERQNYKEIVDGTNLAVQNYMDERNLDREQFADLYANAVTNRANTYNLNTLTPYYDIDPRTGGMVMNVDTAGLFKPVQPSDPYAQIDKLSKYAKLAKASGLSDDVINNIFLGSGVYTPTSNQTRADIIRNAGGINLPYNNTTTESGKKGKQVKAPAVPFYIGVTDGRRK
tara:strand:- start:906 stop:3308 length:2403 start_codon:yes stop_codon:yes gene_type:complete